MKEGACVGACMGISGGGMVLRPWRIMLGKVAFSARHSARILPVLCPILLVFCRILMCL